MLRNKIIVCLILCAMLLAGCNEVQPAATVEFATRPEPSYKTTEVIRDNFTLTSKATANFVYLDSQQLLCEYSGATLVEAVSFSANDIFYKGDVIAKFKFSVSEAELERMELNYYQASLSAAQQIESYENKIRQYAQQALSGGTDGQIAALRKTRTENELKLYQEKTYASLIKQQEELEAYRDKFTEKVLVAPEDGMVVENVSLKAGASISEGAAILTYTTGSNVQLRLNNLNSAYQQLMTTGMKVTIFRGKQSIEGVVSASPTGIADNLDNQYIYIQSDQLDTLEYRSYYSIECDLLVLHDMLLLDSNAVHYDGNTAYVMLLQNGQAVKREIICGLESGKLICVLDGLSEGQQVITNY